MPLGLFAYLRKEIDDVALDRDWRSYLCRFASRSRSLNSFIDALLMTVCWV
jgi:hypothetical protein